MLNYLFLQREGDREFIEKFIDGFSSDTDTKLVDYYNQQQKLGFVGVHKQAQAIVALNIVFTRRFGKSPIRISENVILEFTDNIELHDSSWRYTDSKTSRQ